MKELKGKILEIVKKNGPILPVKIAKVIDKDVLFTSAVLSELVSDKEVKLSFQNLGGSPVYYVKGQENKLDMLFGALALKEKEAYKLLKKEGVLLDVALEPGIRVALRNIKDFARFLKVNFKDQELMLWRWYLVDNKKFEELAEKFFKKRVEKKPLPEIEEKVERKEVVSPKAEREIKREKLLGEPFRKTFMKNSKKVEQKKLVEKKKETKDEFLDKVKEYLRKNNITVLEEEVVKKKREVDLVVKIPSGIGDLLYFVKARDKKTINKADLISAFYKGQEEKLPVLFLGTGKLGKKVEENLEKDFNGYLVFKKFEE